MLVLRSGAPFHEDALPAEIRALGMPRWAGACLGGLLMVAAVAEIAAFAMASQADGLPVPAWTLPLLLVTATTSAIVGPVLLWYAGESVTLTGDAAIVRKGFSARVRVDRAALEGFHPYLHQYADRAGVQYRMVPTFTIRDPYGRLRDVPLTFLGYWDPEGGTQAPLPPRAAYIEAWAHAVSNPYSRHAASWNVPRELAEHRQAMRTGLRRRARRAAILIPVASITLGLALGFGIGPASRALGIAHSADAQTNRPGVRDLDDSLTPSMKAYQWRARETAPGTRNFTFYPTLSPLPPAPYTVRYFIRDPAQNGAALSIPEQKYGRIISQGTITVTNPALDFTLENDGTVFTFEVYVTDDRGHTTLDSDLYRKIDAGPTPPQ